MSGDDTLEDRLDRIEASLHKLRRSMVSYCTQCRMDRKLLNESVAKHQVMIHGDGNGHRGLDKRVFSLEQSEKWRRWWSAALITAMLALIGAWAVELFKAAPVKGP